MWQVKAQTTDEAVLQGVLVLDAFQAWRLPSILKVHCNCRQPDFRQGFGILSVRKIRRAVPSLAQISQSHSENPGSQPLLVPGSKISASGTVPEQSSVQALFACRDMIF